MFRQTNYTLFSSSYIRALIIAASALIFLSAQPCNSQTPETKTTPETVILATGKTIEREIAGGVEGVGQGFGQVPDRAIVLDLAGVHRHRESGHANRDL